MKLKLPFFYVKMNPISIHRLSHYVAAVITVSVIQSPLYISSDNSLQYFKRGKSSRVTAIIPLFIVSFPRFSETTVTARQTENCTMKIIKLYRTQR